MLAPSSQLNRNHALPGRLLHPISPENGWARRLGPAASLSSAFIALAAEIRIKLDTVTWCNIMAHQSISKFPLLDPLCAEKMNVRVSANHDH